MEQPRLDDEAVSLVNRWREGDEDAATALYQRYFERLMQIVSRQLVQTYKKQVEPEDVLQSAFGTVFRRIKNGDFSFETDGDVWKLLVTVVLNKLRHRVRYLNAGRRDIRRELRSEADFDGVLAAQLSQPPGMQEAVEFADLVRDVFDFLPEAERTMLQLRMEGYGQQEIAERLGVTDRTIRRMWDRLRERLVSLFQEQDL